MARRAWCAIGGGAAAASCAIGEGAAVIGEGAAAIGGGVAAIGGGATEIISASSFVEEENEGVVEDATHRLTISKSQRLVVAKKSRHDARVSQSLRDGDIRLLLTEYLRNQPEGFVLRHAIQPHALGSPSTERRPG